MIIFANGKEYETISVWGGTMVFQNAGRRTLEIQIPHDKATFEELVEIYSDEKALETIITKEDDSQNVHLHYTLPVSLGVKDIDGVQAWSMKVAEMSALELAQREQAADIEDLDLAIMELADLIVEGE